MSHRFTNVFLYALFAILIGQGIFGAIFRTSFKSSQSGQILKCPPQAVGELKIMADLLGIKTIVTADTNISMSSTLATTPIMEGFPKVYGALGSRVDKLDSLDTYVRGVLLLASATLVGILLPFGTLKFARFWFFAGLLLLAGLSVSCAFCRATSGLATIDNFIPIIALIAYGIVVIPLFFGLTSPSLIRLATITEVGLCLSPAILIFFLPKACPFCAGLLTINIVLLRFFSHLGTNELGILQPPLFNGKFAVSILALVMLSKVGMIAGVIGTPERRLADYTKFKNVPLDELVVNLPTDYSGVLLVGLPHCSACELAKEIFKSKAIEFEEISECEQGQKTPCVRKYQMPGLLSPTIIRATNGKIKAAYAGWPSTPSSQNDLLRAVTSDGPG